jgi:hypothetical protein
MDKRDPSMEIELLFIKKEILLMRRKASACESKAAA